LTKNVIIIANDCGGAGGIPLMAPRRARSSDLRARACVCNIIMSGSV